MNMLRNIFIALVLLAFSPHLSVHAGEAGYPAWDFKDPGDLKGWVGEGIRASGIDGEAFILIGEEKVQLRFPPGLVIDSEKNNYLRIRLRIYSSRLIQIFWATQRSGKQLPAIPFHPHLDQHFHTYWIDLSESLEWIGRIDMMGLAFFGQPGRLEIDSIEIRPFSISLYLLDQWHEFWLPRSLHLGTINSLSSPYIGGRSLVSMLNLLAVIVLIIGAAFYFRSSRLSRRQIIISVGSIILGFWMVYDIRETYSQFQIAVEINRTHVKPPSEEKTYPSLGNFLNFVGFCEKHLPQYTQYHFYREWPYDTRIKYFLYPRRINCDASSQIISGQPIPYHVVYQNPLVKYDPLDHRLRYNLSGEEFIISKPGKIIATFDPNSFIFLEERN